ncbi:hypothetical protein NW762_010785 [Fusarium torreyae]|uniref:Fungal N-terminal domain-containing protein n=1 Tax=Fusarium torreyae TaxID=1237075 RepID=A0A9W8RSG6_9HYPO|nr:hypothetical protein NW762_010785 [Fusarium torreyae]
MADPLSIASGIAGLVSLGLTVCSGLQTYVNATKGRSEDIESTCQLLTLLRSYIDLIGSSTSTLINRYARATQGVSLGVVQDLGVGDGIPNASSKWRKQKAAALYPFNRTKLMQTQEQLLKATGVLGTFVQSLIL